MIEIGRRGFITGLGALVAAPAVIRVAPLMPISSRWTPAYVPIDWLFRKYGMEAFPLGGQGATLRIPHAELVQHAWSRPMADNWIDVNDYDPGFVRAWVERESEEDWFQGYGRGST